MQAILMKADCRLINYSDAIKKDKNFRFLLPLLEEDRKIMPDEKDLSSENLELLKSQKEDLLKVCTDEWEPVSNLPRINNEKNIKCDLCGRPDLVELFDIRNSHNNQVITIGGNCINKFSALKKANRLVSNSDELSRYNDLLKYIPNVGEIYYQGDFINSTKYILPQNYIDDFKVVEKKLRTYVRKYIKFGTTKANDYLKLNELRKLLKNFSVLKKRIITFPDESNDELMFLPRFLATEIINGQPNGKKIVTMVQQNNGIISPSNAQKIESINFLKRFINQINNKIVPKASIESIKHGTFVVAIKYSKKNILMTIPSNLCMKEIMFSKESDFNFKLFFTKNSSEITTYNNESKLILKDVANDVLSKQFEYRTYYPSPSEIVDSIRTYRNNLYNFSEKEKQKTLTQLVNKGYMFANDEKTFIRRTVKEINQMTSKNLYYNETSKVMQTFSPQDIATGGWKILQLKPVKYTENESKKLLKRVNKVLSEVNLYKKINSEELLEIAEQDLIYIAKYNLYFENFKIAENKIRHYEMESTTTKNYLRNIVNAIGRNN